MPTDSEKEAEYAKRILKKADKILADVDDAYIIRERGHFQRPMPLFRPEEVTLGPILGQGGFGVVNEVSNFCLDTDETEDKVPQGGYAEHEPKSSDTATPPKENANPAVHEATVDNLKGRVKQNSIDNNVHYDVLKARELMKANCLKNRSARYALKRLHDDLSDLEKARGMIDLAVEAKYLSVVWHPNIVKMRGMAKGSLVDPDFFIIMDRLYETLDKRIEHWYTEEKKSTGKMLGLGKRPKRLKQLLVERMTVAYDLAAAFFYLHENRLVYRDIKPENIGFDFRGDVKVFDFGLCKSLSSKLKARDGYGYRLTGRAGSLPYMAPEVAKMETYDTKCDVYSFAILMWEIMSLKQAFKGMSASSFMEKVVMQHGRLVVPKTFPPLTRLMIPEAWDSDPQKRPDMKRVAILIRGDLNDMTNDEAILRRTKHMKDRSNHSFSGFDIDD
jgi:serine/threonine protein kinase